MIRFTKTVFGRVAGTVVLCALLAGICTTQTGCSNASIVNNIQAAVNGAGDVVKAMKSADPNDKRIAAVEKWVTDGQAFLNAYQSAPGACADLVTRAASLVSAFTAAILPLMSVNPFIAAAIVGIDVALRVIAANFHTCVQKAVSAVAKLPGKMRPSVAADVDSVSSSDAVLVNYLATPKLKK
jgi:hypothetical protein